MQVKRVIPSGFCKGVIRAVQIARKAREDHPNEDIYVLGMIVHNHFVTEALEKYKIVTLDCDRYDKEELIGQLDHGILILTAHGTPQKLKNLAIERGLTVIDAACSDVIKTQEIIKEKIDEGYDILYIGKRNHPEALAVLALDEHIVLIESANDLNALSFKRPLFVTNQTTLAFNELEDIFQAILKRWPKALIQKEICHATSSRQAALTQLKDCDLLYVIGDQRSNNTKQLKKIALSSGIPKVIMIASARELKVEDLKGVENIYVTAGASTPTYLTDQVIETLRRYADQGIWQIPKIDPDRILF